VVVVTSDQGSSADRKEVGEGEIEGSRPNVMACRIAPPSSHHSLGPAGNIKFCIILVIVRTTAQDSLRNLICNA
jgi:hypothetical protein